MLLNLPIVNINIAISEIHVLNFTFECECILVFRFNLRFILFRKRMRCNILLRLNGLIECFSVTYIMSVNMAIELIVVFQFAFESHMKLRTLTIVKMYYRIQDCERT